ncbi:MAG TPA: UvrD-helicase domain-containing protein [Bacteroidales bacterium]|nr:UvrD-helicase domain-containing protein [Bacteroidales bacterium]
MGTGTLTIYSASAGSGKTFRLTGTYLAQLFKSRYRYRRILAVTFTNKATAEMKSRILDHLHRLAAGESSDYLEDLEKSTGKDEKWIRDEAGQILGNILHDYTRFSVMTIDSFFQKVLRSFAREAGLHSGFNIEIDHSTILSSAIDEMISSSPSDKRLMRWLTTYALSNIDDERSWNIKDGIARLAEELFREQFKILSEAERKNLEDKDFLTAYINDIRSIISEFESALTILGQKTLDIFISYNLDDEMFYQKSRGVPNFIRSLASGNVTKPNSYVRAVMGAEPKWSSGSTDTRLEAALNNGLAETVMDAIACYDENITVWSTAKAILANIYALGILSDVLYHVHVITNAENSFLLSDAGDVLNLITGSGQSPFIYEKIGTRYDNFMIDEFQDTSRIQWNNFRHLVENSMSEGNDNLVVGDVKQSIYRWRNSDWRILGRELDRLVDDKRFMKEPLATNWRSRSNIISFNNQLFTVIPRRVDESLRDMSLPVSFSDLYAEAVQSDPGKRPGGYVKIEFIPDYEDISWQDTVLERLPVMIESVQDMGYGVSDIGIIVRSGREGSMVLRSIIDYGNSCTKGKKEKYNYNIVSNDSLLLSNSPVINFIVSVLSVVNNEKDMISRAVMLRYYLIATGHKDAEDVPLISKDIEEISNKYLPEDYDIFLDSLRQYTLFEIVEHVIGFFKLGSFQGNIAFLNTFQDHIINFSGSVTPDTGAFLEWWETSGKGKSVVLPDNEEAMRVLTIHKSKGLEFKVVLLPFLSWTLDHPFYAQPVLWIKPGEEPFNRLGIVPVKYGKNLEETIFRENYMEEKYSVYLDNINLLYVAFTRARDVLLGFAPAPKERDNTIAGVLYGAFTDEEARGSGKELSISSLFDRENGIATYGEMPLNASVKKATADFFRPSYNVDYNTESLRLKLHGENYFSSEGEAVRKRINYGKLMHSVFEGINSVGDIGPAVRKLVIDGVLPEDESHDIERKVRELMNEPQIAEWFDPDNEVMTEAAILLRSGATRRPDRVIFRNGQTTVIDFKFGEEHKNHVQQVMQYSALLGEMGYTGIDAYIWYVDRNKIVKA